MSIRWRRQSESTNHGTKRVRVTMGHAGRSYSPTSTADLFFLHGLAVVAARHALREEQQKLYVPAEWDESS